MVETDTYGFVAIKRQDGGISLADSIGGGTDIYLSDDSEDIESYIASYIRSQADEIASMMLEELEELEDEEDED